MSWRVHGGRKDGGGAGVPATTETLSNAAVAVAVVEWLDTPSPTFTAAPMPIVSVSTSVQICPSADW